MESLQQGIIEDVLQEPYIIVDDCAKKNDDASAYNNGGNTISASSRRDSLGAIRRKQKDHVDGSDNKPTRGNRLNSIVSIVVAFLLSGGIFQIVIFHHIDPLPLHHQPNNFINQSHWNVPQHNKEEKEAALKREGFVLIPASPKTEPRVPIAPHATPTKKASNDTNPILNVLKAAGVYEALQKEDESNILPSIPSVWKQMEQLYGPMQEPIVVGLDRCADYRKIVPEENDRYVGPAGMFNTGTNALSFHLVHNMPQGVQRPPWQIPWGKHRVVNLCRKQHIAPGMNKWDQSKALPIVIIRDPFNWMVSMCKSPYAAHWKHRLRCPNLVPNDNELERYGAGATLDKNGTKSFPVKVIFDENQIVTWDSLLHLWSDWYKQYLEGDYPRIIIRFEDMLVHPMAIMKQVGACVTGKSEDELAQKPFKFQIDSAKGHGSHTNFAGAIIKSGNVEKRRAMLTTEDLTYAKQHLDADLMRIFQYTIPSPSLVQPASS